MIEYQKILNKNMVNVLKDILKEIRDNGLLNGNHLYITFLTSNNNVKLPNWIKQKYSKEMTIVIQYEYYDLKVNNDSFSITLSFNDIKANLLIGYDAIISFADPSANFGLILKNSKLRNEVKTNSKIYSSKKNNVIDFSNYKKN